MLQDFLRPDREPGLPTSTIMQPQIEVFESRLAALLMGELVRSGELVEVREADDTYVDIILDDLDLDD